MVLGARRGQLPLVMAAGAFYAVCTVAARSGLLEAFLVSSAWAVTIHQVIGNHRALHWSLCLAGAYAMGVAWVLVGRIEGSSPSLFGLHWDDWHKLASIAVYTCLSLVVFNFAQTRWEYLLERAIALSLIPSIAAFAGIIDASAHVGWLVASNVAFIAIILSGRPGRADAQDHYCGFLGSLLRSIAASAKQQKCNSPWTKN